jgi:hypothetical protein
MAWSGFVEKIILKMLMSCWVLVLPFGILCERRRDDAKHTCIADKKGGGLCMWCETKWYRIDISTDEIHRGKQSDDFKCPGMKNGCLKINCTDFEFLHAKNHCRY